MWSRAFKTLCAVGLIAAGAASARADLIPTLVGGGPTVGPVISGTQYFTWTYNVSLSAVQNLQTNNFVTIYDTVGLLSGSEVGPATWTGGDMLTGVNAPGVVPITGDSGSILNVVFSYQGGATVAGPQASLGQFSFLSTDSIVGVGSFTAEGILNSGPNAGSTVGNTGSVSVPVPSEGQGGPGVPLPAAFPAGMALLSYLGFRKHAKAQ